MIPQVLTFSNNHCCCVAAQLCRVDFKLAIFICSIKDLVEQVTSVTYQFKLSSESPLCQLCQVDSRETYECSSLRFS